MIAKSAGYDSLFIDLEHTTLTIKDASTLCTTALGVGITPFVRVPWQCGNGFVQRVLDLGAMGVVFPHIHSVGTWSFAPCLSCFVDRSDFSIVADQIIRV